MLQRYSTLADVAITCQLSARSLFPSKELKRQCGGNSAIQYSCQNADQRAIDADECQPCVFPTAVRGSWFGTRHVGIRIYWIRCPNQQNAIGFQHERIRTTFWLCFPIHCSMQHHSFLFLNLVSRQGPCVDSCLEFASHFRFLESRHSAKEEHYLQCLKDNAMRCVAAGCIFVAATLVPTFGFGCSVEVQVHSKSS